MAIIACRFLLYFSKTLRGLIDSIENAPIQCRSGLEKQAGFPNNRGKLFSGYLDIIRTCESSADSMYMHN